MASYRYNLFLDTFRLVRGIFFKSHLDPYIQANPATIGSRKSLFHFDWITHESGDYEYAYGEYRPYLSSQPLLIQYLPLEYASDAYAHLMVHREQRVKEVTGLLVRSGISVDATRESWSDIGEWVYQHIEENREPGMTAIRSESGEFLTAEAMLRPIWHSLIIDLSLLLGEQLINLKAGCGWYFWGESGHAEAARFGTTPWILCESTPAMGKWHHKPDRLLPFDLISDAITFILSRKLLAIRVNPLGTLFEQVAGMPVGLEKPEQPIPEDSEVMQICEWLAEYKQQSSDRMDTKDKQQALSDFLYSYRDSHGFLPSQHDLEILKNCFGQLPDWVRGING